MPPHAESPGVSRRRRPAPPPARRPPAVRAAPPSESPRATAAAPADRGSPPLRDRGLSALFVFTTAMLVMVGLAALTAIVGRWWILAPVMVVDLAATTAVLAMIARLLADGDER